MPVIASSIRASDDSLRVIGTLVNASMSSMELETVLPWERGIDKSISPKRDEHCWVYGTRFWDMFTAEQRAELAWLEIGRDVTAFIKLERFLPVLYVGYINKYRDALPKEIYDYLLVFSKEEIVHTLMFKRFMRLGSLPLIMDPESPYKAFLDVVNDIPPVYGILFTLLVEWAAELNAMYLTQHDEIEPLTRKMFREHHLEEVRHIAFGKRLVEDHLAQAEAEESARIRDMFLPIISGIYKEITFNRTIGEHTSFPFPIGQDDQAAIAEVRESEHSKRINGERFKDMNRWLTSLGLV